MNVLWLLLIGQLSPASLWGCYTSSNPCIYMRYGGGDR